MLASLNRAMPLLGFCSATPPGAPPYTNISGPLGPPESSIPARNRGKAASIYRSEALELFAPLKT